MCLLAICIQMTVFVLDEKKDYISWVVISAAGVVTIYEASVSSPGPAFIFGLELLFFNSWLSLLKKFLSSGSFLHLNHFLICYKILSVPPTETAATVVKWPFLLLNLNDAF